jgi:uncharacterized protein
MQPEETNHLPAEAAPVEVTAETMAATVVHERTPFWGYQDLLLVLGLLVASMVLIGLIAGALMYSVPKLRADQTPLMVPMNLALYGALYLSLWVAFATRYGRPVLRSLGWRKTNSNWLLLGLGGVLLALVISLLASAIHTPKIPTPFDDLARSPMQFALFSVMAVAIAPFFEELFFRGFVQPLVSRSFGTGVGILLPSVLFGCLHLPEYAWAWQYAVFISLAGAVFGWLRARTDSIIPSTVMHGAFNAVSVVALAFGKNI